MSGLPLDTEKTKAAGVGTKATSENNQQAKNSGNEASAQCSRLLPALHLGLITTMEVPHAIDALISGSQA